MTEVKSQCILIELCEDLHVGSGMGQGDIDALYVRDRWGRPVIPASHLKGVWRAVAEEWAAVSESGIGAKDIERLFGKQGRSRGLLQLTSAYLDGRTDSLVWGSTAIDDLSGKAEDKSLRFVEYVPAKSRFTLRVQAREEDLKQLERILARTSSLGHGRHRGYGRVRWQIASEERVTSVPIMGQARLPGRLRLMLRNLDPLCLPRTGHPGNLIESETFIRGRTLRGAVVAALLGQGEAKLAQRLLSDTLSWADALPLPGKTCSIETAEVMPMPLSVGTPKPSARTSLPWWAESAFEGRFGAQGEIDQLTSTKTEDKAKLKRPKEDEFLFRESDTAPWQRYRPQRFERLHTAVPDSENSYAQSLFSTEEVAEDTLFLADLIVTREEDAQALGEAIERLAGVWLRVGRGGRPVVIEKACWLDLPSHGQAEGSGFTLLLLSDLIVRDAFGNAYERLGRAPLERLLGKPLPEGCEVRAFSEGTTLYGFNAMTGMPRLASRAIRAGSVVRIEGSGAVALREQLAQHLVLGESPDEGFGRFLLDAMPKPWDAHGKSETSPFAWQTQSSMVERERLCAKARELAQKFAKDAHGPSRSQWGRVRSEVQAARSKEELKEVFSLIEKAAEKHGGKAWQVVRENPDYDALKKAVCDGSDFQSGQLFFDFFLRWLRVPSEESA